MNILIIIGLVLGGGTIAFDRLIRKLPNRLAVVLYAATAVLMVTGMVISR